MSDLSFREPDLERFPCLGLALDALREGRGMPVSLNAANEIAVEAFLEGQIRFDQIPHVVGRVLERFQPQAITCLEDVLELDTLARRHAAEIMQVLP